MGTLLLSSKLHWLLLQLLGFCYWTHCIPCNPSKFPSYIRGIVDNTLIRVNPPEAVVLILLQKLGSEGFKFSQPQTISYMRMTTKEKMEESPKVRKKTLTTRKENILTVKEERVLSIGKARFEELAV